MELLHTPEYESYGLGDDRQASLALLGDLILAAGFNITAVREPEEIERQHFLDSLSLLRLPRLAAARRMADVGSGGGLPALVLALALPECEVVAIESQRKKCAYIEKTAEALSLSNVGVVCGRAEDYGHSSGREAHDVVVSRAVGPLAVVAEYSVPLLGLGGLMVAMKGAVSDQERIQASEALDILGAGGLEAVRLEPFAGASNRWAYLAAKRRPTPNAYPRRSGTPAKHPLG